MLTSVSEKQAASICSEDVALVSSDGVLVQAVPIPINGLASEQQLYIP